MSKHKIRKDKTCQNCGYFVDQNYCPQCGQENTEVRHTLLYLIKHFTADLLHYDSSFWTTLKLLLFSPAKLSLEYLAGRRRKYVDPIKLYIFISFIAFFIPGILPEKKSETESIKVSHHNELMQDSLDANLELELDLALKKAEKKKRRELEYEQMMKNLGDSIMYENKAYDSKDFAALVDSGQLSIAEYYFIKVINKNRTLHKDNNRKERIKDFLITNLPKVLFIYMPIFAFFLWLFNNKKKFLYFDSAIFTLHYFSFLLLTITVLAIANCLFDWLNISTVWLVLLIIALFFYTIGYFFKAHRRFYQQSKWLSFFKSFIILQIDWFAILVILIFYAIFAVLWV